MKKYIRYADDSIIVLRKRHFRKILDEFNQYDPNLKWIFEEQVDGKFLDTIVLFKDNTISLEHHQKGR